MVIQLEIAQLQLDWTTVRQPPDDVVTVGTGRIRMRIVAALQLKLRCGHCQMALVWSVFGRRSFGRRVSLGLAGRMMDKGSFRQAIVTRSRVEWINFTVVSSCADIASYFIALYKALLGNINVWLDLHINDCVIYCTFPPLPDLVVLTVGFPFVNCQSCTVCNTWTTIMWLIIKWDAN